MNHLSLFAIAAAMLLAVDLLAADEKKMTIVDYYLLLPDKTFEAPVRSWLQNATVVDKENGYMNITGDGAQPNFEVALFRYRDGRPLLAVCEGELEGDDRVALNFYELGKDGKMQSVPRKIFPISDQWASEEPNKKYEDLRFELPRQGRTVVVRSAKTKKVLHRVTWNGEKFVQQRDAAPK